MLCSIFFSLVHQQQKKKEKLKMVYFSSLGFLKMLMHIHRFSSSKSNPYMCYKWVRIVVFNELDNWVENEQQQQQNEWVQNGDSFILIVWELKWFVYGFNQKWERCTNKVQKNCMNRTKRKYCCSFIIVAPFIFIWIKCIRKCIREKSMKKFNPQI